MSRQRGANIKNSINNNNNNNNNINNITSNNSDSIDTMATNSDINNSNNGGTEQEPLLGRIGDVQQKDEGSFWPNIILGTGILAQIGILLLIASVWTAVFTHDLMLFSVHPLANSLGIALFSQSILLLQPTHTNAQKKKGAFIHAILNFTSMALLTTGVVVIYINKAKNGHGHFQSPHAIMGIINYVLLWATYLVGATIFFVPQLYGGVTQAKKLYKVHRLFGYLNYTFLLATVISATKVDYVEHTLKLKTWQPILASFFIICGMFSRIKKQKFGFEVNNNDRRSE